MRVRIPIIGLDAAPRAAPRPLACPRAIPHRLPGQEIVVGPGVHDYIDEREETAGPFLAIPLLSSLDYSLGRSHQTRPSLIVSNQPAFGVDGMATAAGILAVLVCGGMPPAMADTIRIEAKGLTFEPAEVSAHVGDTIEWTNSDFVANTATAPNGDWISCRHTVCGE